MLLFSASAFEGISEDIDGVTLHDHPPDSEEGLA